ncbi:hypothetical protein IWQ61_009787 [Dispira simplex]|nr:hypothetical protein IWQ61_009787 [Dispira simplex]
MEPKTDLDNSVKPEDTLSIPDMITFDKEEQDLTLDVPEHILSTINSAKLAKLSEDYKMSMDDSNHPSLDQRVAEGGQSKLDIKDPSPDVRTSSSSSYSTSSSASKSSVTSLVMSKTKLSPSRPQSQGSGQYDMSSTPTYYKEGQKSDGEAVPHGYHQGAPLDDGSNDPRLNEKSPSMDNKDDDGNGHSREEPQKQSSTWSLWFNCCFPSRN